MSLSLTPRPSPVEFAGSLFSPAALPSLKFEPSHIEPALPLLPTESSLLLLALAGLGLASADLGLPLPSLELVLPLLAILTPPACGVSPPYLELLSELPWSLGTSNL